METLALVLTLYLAQMSTDIPVEGPTVCGSKGSIVNRKGVTETEWQACRYTTYYRTRSAQHVTTECITDWTRDGIVKCKTIELSFGSSEVGSY